MDCKQGAKRMARMDTLFKSLRYNAARIADFSGKDSRAQFWPYAGVVLVLGFIGLVVVLLHDWSAMLREMSSLVGVAPTETFANMPQTALRMGIPLAGVVVLLAAAMVRRLRDGGRSAFWALLPFPFLGVGLWGMSHLMSVAATGGAVDLARLMAIILCNMAYLAALAWLIALLGAESSAPSSQA
jgi:uncharacterized membrane protein YhaH (DUF805 family)